MADRPPTSNSHPKPWPSFTVLTALHTYQTVPSCSDRAPRACCSCQLAPPQCQPWSFVMLDRARHVAHALASGRAYACTGPRSRQRPSFCAAAPATPSLCRDRLSRARAPPHACVLSACLGCGAALGMGHGGPWLRRSPAGRPPPVVTRCTLWSPAGQLRLRNSRMLLLLRPWREAARGGDGEGGDKGGGRDGDGRRGVERREERREGRRMRRRWTGAARGLNCRGGGGG